MKNSKALLRALAVVAVLAVPFGLAAPAHASTTSNGCTVAPRLPYHNGDFTAAGEKWINYDVEIDCAAGSTIEVEMERWEADSGLNGADDRIGESTKVRYFSTTSEYIWSVPGVLPDNDGGFDQYSEMYQLVRFRVTCGDVTSPWTAFESSGVRSIHV